MYKILKCAAIAGILLLIDSILSAISVSLEFISIFVSLGVVSIPFEISDVLESLSKLKSSLPIPDTLLSFASLILFIIFVWGFKIIGEKYWNNLLKIASYILIVIAVISYGSHILISISPSLDNFLAQILPTVLMGVAMILFGIGLLKLKIHFGSIATAVGTLEIISGISFLTVFLSPIGIILFIPGYILLLIILFRAAKKLETSPAI